MVIQSVCKDSFCVMSFASKRCLNSDNKIVTSKLFIGLSFFERPILDHDAKAYNFEIRQISCGFHVKNLINQMFQQKLFSLGGCRGGYDLGFPCIHQTEEFLLKHLLL